LVKERLKDLGYTEKEIKARLDRLSDSEFHTLPTFRRAPYLPWQDILTPQGEVLTFTVGFRRVRLRSE
jgi:hypothetical protein